jgi:hypothetical protein
MPFRSAGSRPGALRSPDWQRAKHGVTCRLVGQQLAVLLVAEKLGSPRGLLERDVCRHWCCAERGPVGRLIVGVRDRIDLERQLLELVAGGLRERDRRRTVGCRHWRDREVVGVRVRDLVRYGVLTEDGAEVLLRWCRRVDDGLRWSDGERIRRTELIDVLAPRRRGRPWGWGCRILEGHGATRAPSSFRASQRVGRVRPRVRGSLWLPSPRAPSCRPGCR